MTHSILRFCLSPSSTLMFKDLVPVLYQEGRYQGDPVTLGVGGFGRVQLVSVVFFFFKPVKATLHPLSSKVTKLLLWQVIVVFDNVTKLTTMCLCCIKMTTLTHGKYYAMKRVSKKQIVAKRQEEHMLFEKKILKAIQCDFIVRYKRSFCRILLFIIKYPAAKHVIVNSFFFFFLQALCCFQRHTVHLHGHGVLWWWGGLDQAERSVRHGTWLSE